MAVVPGDRREKVQVEEGEVVMHTDFKQLCFGWTLAFVLVVGSILILGQFGPCGPDSLRPFESRRSSRKAVTLREVLLQCSRRSVRTAWGRFQMRAARRARRERGARPGDRPGIYGLALGGIRSAQSRWGWCTPPPYLVGPRSRIHAAPGAT